MEVKNTLAAVANRPVATATPARPAGGAASAVVATPSAQGQSFLNAVAQSTRLSVSDRQAVIDVAATIDSQPISANSRQSSFRQLAELTHYLEQSGGTDVPKWNVLTALRTYGHAVKVQEAKEAARPEPTAQTKIDVALQQVADQTRGVDMQAVQAVNAQAPKATVERVTQMIGKHTDVVDSGSSVPAEPVHKADIEV